MRSKRIVRHSKFAPAMTAWGQKRRFLHGSYVSFRRQRTSGLFGYGREVPTSGCEQSQQGSPLFDHLVGAGEQQWRHFEAKRLGGLEVDD
jgi:hypothetical protein